MPLVWLIIISLLWSQFAVAMHAVECAPLALSGSTSAQGCHDAPLESDGERHHDGHDPTTCAGHCGTDYSADKGRLSVPSGLPPVTGLFMLRALEPDTRCIATEPSNRAYWHGPTGHPSGILLI